MNPLTEMFFAPEEAEKLRIAEKISLARLRELAEAEREGRVVVLPCKVGTIVYGVVDVVSQGYPDPTITPTVFEKRFELSDIRRYGKSIFLLPEQAEARRALAATDPKGDAT